ncbi:1-deoxy-D-xylulose-5-phosphate synthase-1-deoxyxylulose-5-phosphate synthase [Moritella viscosa]|uniref:1-deoxy-D-xylulose-5-phosphate synthase n=1 Tax=Moritella viscosa TaxID=80854 RepID=A0A090IK13_9GAMM|nr:1-deoxy-D-xylulose-5-phosphate synthase [Moritella viscosa]CED61632.1 1-deoxy-D-xylulose-5-phosphate synthase [Moritella viscosa]SGY98382.1 1-deoxy-D-xylulose-5-phosphate synthase-1-deoxyxylulose-5-phosphate synthase [Moritella viscosa]SHO05257.1 1-deoxy-D-xylulose-5-phosphate synthase-1-deoxyxylulose-5-phosphate synthase [Moritella viscosa]SHO05259.1 1-deoxy-D-xylulose-5-phosphate synthase-1-deoxyxylulose-5-phosphate synthase [Moritella viscosa]SHO06135.1 1-deoxy-D-xylulose-5-phosphate syn
MSLDISNYPTLALADIPEELRQLPADRLDDLCDELRSYLLHTVGKSGGHFASGLGVVELTVALHYVYNTPYDKLLWDVGHQAYPHKILTGRRDRMSTIRQKGGLHPFPWRDESEYDHLNVGHSSTSISAALGLAVAADQEDKNRKTVAIIGDGAITGGMAFEALNHAGHIDKDVLVILNDNDMSISENVGAVNKHLAKLLSGVAYSSFRENGKKVLSGIPPIKELARRAEEHLKGMVVPSTLFEEFGFNYIGPIDGHDVNGLVETLRNMRSLKGPQFLHVITKKGKGYAPAEQDQLGYHAVPKFNPEEDTLPVAAVSKPTFSKIFGNWLCDVAATDKKLAAVTPAMGAGSGMIKFSETYPQQYFDVAIAEQHCVTFAAGLAIGGHKPVVAIYSTFLQRGYDQLIHDVAIQDIPVLFAIDRAGLVGADGQTHQGAFDISFMRCIPKMVIMTPSDENECRQMLHTGYQYNGPAAVRYPRGSGTGIDVEQAFTKFEIGKGIVRRQGEKVAILCFGTLMHNAMPAAERLNATVVDMRFAKPLDEALLAEMANSHDILVTLEDGAIMGGAGSGVNEYLMANKLMTPTLNLGLPDKFIHQGTQDEIYAELGLDDLGIEASIKAFIAL